MNGRYAPSPTGDFHLGNLRTALLAWYFARSTGRGFVMRLEDLDDRARLEHRDSQLRDLELIGIDWDSVMVQSERSDAYAEVVDDLQRRGLLYECYCTRADIRNAPSAPHLPPGAYPGTCRELTASEREAGRDKLSGMNRGPALRLATDHSSVTMTDLIKGEFTGEVDDIVIVRGDGVLAYNLVAVVDDAAQDVSQVVRADDLLDSTPRQIYLQRLLGLKQPEYLHVPLVLGPSGDRLAKRDGAVTLTQLRESGLSIQEIMELMTESLGCRVSSAQEFLDTFSLENMPCQPWVFDPAELPA